MNNCDNCFDNRPRIGRLSGVTRTMRLAIYEGEGVPTGTPQDLSTMTSVVVRVLRDGTGDIYLPEFIIEGDDNNVVKFVWPAAEQAVGNYTIDVVMNEGENVNRVNWHGSNGIRLVQYSNQVYGEDAIGEKSNEETGLIGYFTTNGVGMSAYQQWLAEGHEGTTSDFITWLRKPATDAAAALPEEVAAAVSTAMEAAEREMTQYIDEELQRMTSQFLRLGDIIETL